MQQIFAYAQNIKVTFTLG